MFLIVFIHCFSTVAGEIPIVPRETTAPRGGCPAPAPARWSVTPLPRRVVDRVVDPTPRESERLEGSEIATIFYGLMGMCTDSMGFYKQFIGFNGVL